MKHSPTPWHIEDGCFISAARGINENWDVAELHGPDIEANAEHIVKCVNGYDTLQAELAAARTEIARLVEIAYGTGPKPPVTADHPETLAAFADLMAPKGVA